MRRVAAQIPNVPSPYMLEAPSFAEPPHPADVHALAEAFGSVPSDYQAFLGLCGRISAMDVHNGYDILPPSLSLRIHQEGHVPKQVGSVPVLPVAGDGGGNLFLLGIRAPHSVWLWNHETGMVVEVSLGFTAFLQRVLEDWEHFARGTKNWRYLVG